MGNFTASLLLFVVFASACSMQQDIEVDLPPHAPITFVECYLEPGFSARALATRSVSFFDSAEIMPADELQLSLYHNGKLVDLVNEYQVDSLVMDVFNYTSDYKVEYDESSRWEMVVRRQDKEIARGTARFLPKPVISNIQHHVSADSMVALEVFIEDLPGQENYYRMRVHNPYTPIYSGFEDVWTDELASNGQLKLSTGYALKAYSDKVYITVYQIDEGYYTFLQSLRKANESNYNPFAQPANVESNLQGEAMGIFTAVSGTTHTLQLQR